MRKSISAGVYFAGCVIVGSLAIGSTAADAQSIQLFGVIDTDLAYVHASGKGSNTYLDNSGMNSSRFGMRGTENLGGGLSAGFWLEGDFTPTNGNGGVTNTNNSPSGATSAGSAIFGRRSFVSLASRSLGEIRLGRDYTPTYVTAVSFDPFTNLGFGGHSRLMSYPITGNTIYARTSNAIFYVTPHTLGGFFGEASYAFGNELPGTATSSDGNAFGVQLGYAGSNFKIAAAIGKTTYADGNIWERNIGGQYDYSVARAYFLLQQVSREGNNRLVQTSVMLAGRVFVPGGAIRVSLIHLHINGDSASDADQVALGYVYNLSKRTQLYSTVAYLRNHSHADFALNSATLAPEMGGASTGVQLGISHAF